MEDENIKAATAMGKRRPRQGEAFWGEMVTTWKASGIGARRFCREQGLAVSTFSLWRKKLSSPVKEIKQPLAVTADAAFIVANSDVELAPRGPSVATPAADASPPRDRVGTLRASTAESIAYGASIFDGITDGRSAT
jgi:hypothetical protein